MGIDHRRQGGRTFICRQHSSKTGFACWTPWAELWMTLLGVRCSGAIFNVASTRFPTPCPLIAIFLARWGGGASLALSHLLVQPSQLVRSEVVSPSLSAKDWPRSMVAWLTQLMMGCAVKRELCCRATNSHKFADLPLEFRRV